MEAWFERYPQEHKVELVSRLRSENETEHSSAIFELVLHEVLVTSGWTVTVHPEVNRTSKKPDFLAECGQDRVYIEATTVRPSGPLHSDDPLEETVLDAIDDLNSPNFFLHLETEGRLTSASTYRKVVSPFERFMSQHDPLEVRTTMELKGWDSRPSLDVVHGSWRLRGYLHPKSKPGNGATRTIGVGPMKVGRTDGSRLLRKAIVDKAGRYGSLDAPLVVAVNAHNLSDRIDEVDALFGKERFSFLVNNESGSLTPQAPSREPDGVWIRGGYQPRYTRLSGVLSIRGKLPWDLHNPNSCLYLNPHARLPIPDHLFSFPQGIVVDEEMTWSEGESLGEIMGLSPDWLPPQTRG